MPKKWKFALIIGSAILVWSVILSLLPSVVDAAGGVHYWRLAFRMLVSFSAGSSIAFLLVRLSFGESIWRLPFRRVRR